MALVQLVGGSLDGALVDVPAPREPLRRHFRRDGVAWSELYVPADKCRAGDYPRVLRIHRVESLAGASGDPPAAAAPSPVLAEAALSALGDRRTGRERRAVVSAGRRSRAPGLP